MSLSKIDRDLGKLGESFLTKLTAEVGITTNKAFEDKTGWDFLLEFPMEKSPVKGISLDLFPAPVSCLIQVKATDNCKKPIQVKLSNWLRMIKSPQPYFFLILDFARKNNCNKAFLVHCGFDTIEKVLKKCRKISNSDEPADLNKLTLAIHLEDNDLLESVNGIALKNKILQNIGPDLHEYTNRKLKFLKSVGYDKLKNKFQIQFDNPGQFISIHDYLVDFAIGKIAELPFQNLKVNEVRFGIPSKQFLVDSKEPGIMTIIRKPGENKATILLVSIDGKNSLRLEMEIFIPDILPMNFPKLRVRLAAAFIEILIPYKNDSSPEFKFHYPAYSEKTNIKELEKVARLISFLNELHQTKALSFRAEYDGNCLSSGIISFNGAISDKDKCIAKALGATALIAEYCKIGLEEETSIEQVMQQENTIDLICSAIKNKFGCLRIEFSLKKKELIQEKSFLIPIVQEIFLGDFRLIFSLAIFGNAELEDIPDDMARVTISQCEGFIFNHYKYTDKAVPEFSIVDCKKEIYNRFKESHIVVFLED